MALLSENGPCSVDKNGSTTSKRIYSWTEVGDVLWLDQPANTGYSYGANNDVNGKFMETLYILSSAV